MKVQVKAPAAPTSLADAGPELLGKRLHKEIEDEENIVSKVVVEEPAQDIIKFDEPSKKEKEDAKERHFGSDMP